MPAAIFGYLSLTIGVAKLIRLEQSPRQLDRVLFFGMKEASKHWVVLTFRCSTGIFRLFRISRDDPGRCYYIWRFPAWPDTNM
jgi:hypothetical protein